jgi:hypothetical protein
MCVGHWRNRFAIILYLGQVEADEKGLDYVFVGGFCSKLTSTAT